MPSGTHYPPEHHLGRDLRIAYRLPEPGQITLTVPATEHLLRPDGSVRTEAVCSIIDEAIGFVAVLQVLPDWGSTAALNFGFTGRKVEPVDTLTVRGHVVKAGRRLVFTECRVTWRDVLVAHAEGQFARVGRAGANVDMDTPEPDPDAVFEMGDAVAGLDSPLRSALGFEESGAAAVRMDFDGYTANSSGLLHGGVASALVIAAAEGGAGAPALAANVQFLSAGREGPFLADACLFDGEQPGIWRSETVDSANGTLMNRAVIRTA